ncbi:hypothetical protein GYMLUDRAFT_253323 [Collybiopsis luxurians FD-317 M1]|uniref:Uncharacterized protein n=1 Tax=Collybiopsis luxurians FD-317 M1 TaxID=944289 RepID=A0A0D0AIU5_9AGAR|nr:hypothetical protein GYMLUDRAFT_253323 [Collybiopsis luxurians FD-317 M1]
MSTLNMLLQKTSAYINLLQSNLYKQMMTASPEVVPPQSYDYDALNAFTLHPKDNKVNEQGDPEQASKASTDSQPVDHRINANLGLVED